MCENILTPSNRLVNHINDPIKVKANDGVNHINAANRPLVFTFEKEQNKY